MACTSRPYNPWIQNATKTRASDLRKQAGGCCNSTPNQEWQPNSQQGSEFKSIPNLKSIPDPNNSGNLPTSHEKLANHEHRDKLNILKVVKHCNINVWITKSIQAKVPLQQFCQK